MYHADDLIVLNALVLGAGMLCTRMHIYFLEFGQMTISIVVTTSKAWMLQNYKYWLP